jgi:hypothetical protein
MGSDSNSFVGTSGGSAVTGPPVRLIDACFLPLGQDASNRTMAFELSRFVRSKSTIS